MNTKLAAELAAFIHQKLVERDAAYIYAAPPPPDVWLLERWIAEFKMEDS